MAFLRKKNNVKSTIDMPVTGFNSSDTLLILSDGSKFPSSGNFLITIWDNKVYLDPGDDPTMEIVKCTSRSLNELTVVRAQESTIAVWHGNGDAAEMLITAGHFEEIESALTSESIWDRTGNTITPQTANDNLDIGNGNITTYGKVSGLITGSNISSDNIIGYITAAENSKFGTNINYWSCTTADLGLFGKFPMWSPTCTAGTYLGAIRNGLNIIGETQAPNIVLLNNPVTASFSFTLNTTYGTLTLAGSGITDNLTIYATSSEPYLRFYDSSTSGEANIKYRGSTDDFYIDKKFSLNNTFETNNGNILSTTGGVTLGGSGLSNNESLTLDFETTSDAVLVSSGTGVTRINFGTIGITSRSNGFSVNIKITTGSDGIKYIAQATDDVIVCNNHSGMTVELPVATGNGKIYEIKNIATGAATLDGNLSDTIDGETTQTINIWECIRVVDYTPNAWIIT